VASGLEERLHLLPSVSVHDRALLAGVHFVLIANVAQIGNIVEELAEGVPAAV
jgi:hypothetical protein